MTYKGRANSPWSDSLYLFCTWYIKEKHNAKFLPATKAAAHVPRSDQDSLFQDRDKSQAGKISYEQLEDIFRIYQVYSAGFFVFLLQICTM